jgi:hypothetical protein
VWEPSERQKVSSIARPRSWDGVSQTVCEYGSSFFLTVLRRPMIVGCPYLITITSAFDHSSGVGC